MSCSDPHRRAQWLIVCRIVYIHLLSLQDGTVYGTPPSGTITYEFPSGTPDVVFQLAVTRSRVMACISTRQETKGILEVVVVWDVETGDPVSSL